MINQTVKKTSYKASVKSVMSSKVKNMIFKMKLTKYKINLTD